MNIWSLFDFCETGEERYHRRNNWGHGCKKRFSTLNNNLMKIKVLCFIAVQECNFHFVILMYVLLWVHEINGPNRLNQCCTQFKPWEYRRYYIAAWRYKISCLVLKNISWASAANKLKIFQHEKRNFVSTSGHVIFYLLYKHQWNKRSFHDRH